MTEANEIQLPAADLDPPRPALDVEAPVEALTDALEAADLRPEAVADLRIAVRAAVAGGNAACMFYGGALEIADKGRNDPVTAADHAANRAILAVLAADAARDPVLSEESPPPESGGKASRLWVVDPLDGTKEFIAQNGEFSIMVGLAVESHARLGAVYQPAIGRVFAGIVGHGAWELIGAGAAAASDAPGTWTVTPLRIGEDRAHAGPIRFVRSRSHPDERLATLASELGEVEEVISGSVGIKCALVARDAADLYVHPVPYLKEWDTCAPEAILRGAGGVVTDCAGEPLEYGDADPHQRGGIFAGTPAAWDRARPLVISITRPMFEDRD